MAEISKELVKDLREKSGAGMGDCLKALQETQGDMTKAFEVLRQKGIASADKRTARQERKGSYTPISTAAARSALWSR